MQSLTRKQDYLINAVFALGLLLSLIPDIFLYDQASPFRFNVALANTILDAALLITVFVFLKVEIRKRRLANAQLEEAAQTKSQFLQIVAHDLRNPLNALLQLAEFLPPEARDTGSIIRSTVCDMVEIIDSLLDISALESGTLKIHPTYGDLAEVVAEVVERNRVQAIRKQQNLILSAPEPCLGEFDRGRIRQSVDNLVSNALKFSPPGKCIRVSVRSVDDELRVEVEDEGPGLTASDQKRLFQRFQRLSAQPTAGESSTGLGLANARHLVELHGGRIGAESLGPGQGSRFWIELKKADGSVAH